MRTYRADDQSAFIKSCDACPEFFEAEARGLALLRQYSGLRVPEVYSVSATRLAMENLGQGRPCADFWELAAAGLAQQHRSVSSFFGLKEAGFCGDSPQDNSPDDNGWRFFAERRLLPQMRWARDQRLISRDDCQRLQALCRDLPNRIPQMSAVLLHGDLWSGNLHVCQNGKPALIDAGAVHYGWAEADLAMLSLFSTPPQRFFDCYRAQTALETGWQERFPIYNLYHLLNHVNLFGGGYVASLRHSLTGC